MGPDSHGRAVIVDFPAPVGGTVLPVDFAPSVVFAILHVVLVPLMIYRILARRSRSFLLLGAVAFSVERVAIYTLRAMQSRNEHRRFNHGLVTYLQVSFAIGFIGMVNDLVNLTRCLLVNPTYGSETYSQSAAAATKGGLMDPPKRDTPDRPRLRLWIRRGAAIMALAFLGALIPGIIANSNYSKVIKNQKKADMTAQLRVASTIIALVSTVLLCFATLLGKLYLKRIANRGVMIIGAMASLIITICIYRLSIMGQRTTSLGAFSPLDTTHGKAAFYVFHAFPEWLATFIIFADNTRKTFGTGLFGDWHFHDETEEQRHKREAKIAEKEHKKTNVSYTSMPYRRVDD